METHYIADQRNEEQPAKLRGLGIRTHSGDYFVGEIRGGKLEVHGYSIDAGQVKDFYFNAAEYGHLDLVDGTRIGVRLTRCGFLGYRARTVMGGEIKLFVKSLAREVCIPASAIYKLYSQN